MKVVAELPIFYDLAKYSKSRQVANQLNARSSPGYQVTLSRPVLRTVRCLSVIAQRRVDFTSMQPVCELGREEPSMECDNETVTPLRDTSEGPVIEKPSKGKQKLQRMKRRASKPGGRKQRARSAEGCSNLMAELPFANTDEWKELGFSTAKSSAKKKRKRGDCGRVESEEDGEKKRKKKNDAPRPNYFVSIPITNPKIKEGVQAIQDQVLQKDPRLAKALIPVGSLHITLLVTHLGTPEQLQQAASVFAELRPALDAVLQGAELLLPFRGIGHFKNEVTFVQLSAGQHLAKLTQIAEAVRKTFEERGISAGDGKDFKPHLTFMKLSRAPKLRRQGIRKLDPELYAEFVEQEFGGEKVCRLDLCSMLKKKSRDGYYHCETSIGMDLFHSTHRASQTSVRRPPDEEELLSVSRRLVDEAVSRALQQYMEETQQNGTPPRDQAPPPKDPSQ